MLDGIIMRSQLLVLLQRRHFCDASGRPLGRQEDEKLELELETEMRTFYRRWVRGLRLFDRFRHIFRTEEVGSVALPCTSLNCNRHHL